MICFPFGDMAGVMAEKSYGYMIDEMICLYQLDLK